MRTTLNLDDDLNREAGHLIGLSAKTDVIDEGLRALLHDLMTGRVRVHRLAEQLDTGATR